jgi:alpha-ribazole phosphatase
MEFQLIRHTPCAVEPGVCYGHLDVPLASAAPEHMAATLRKTGPADIVFSSPAQRCLALATLLAQRDACALRVSSDLRELCFGEWEGRRWDDIPRATSEHWAEDTWQRAPPGGETEQALWLRLQRCHLEMLATHIHEQAQRIAVVAHGGSLRLLRCLLLERPMSERWQWHIELGEVHTVPGRPTGRPLGQAY